jgi:hypothetical protein
VRTTSWRTCPPSWQTESFLLGAGAAAPGMECRVVRPVAELDVIGCLRARETTLIYDPRTKTLQSDTPEAVATVIGRAS